MILCGGSAGALCWFDHALSGFHEGPEREIAALGLLPWSCAVHYREEPGRRQGFLDAIGNGLPAGYGAAPRLGAASLSALHFVGTELAEAVSSRPQASAVFASCASDGAVVERELAVRYLGATALLELSDAAALAA